MYEGWKQGNALVACFALARLDSVFLLVLIFSARREAARLLDPWVLVLTRYENAVVEQVLPIRQGVVGGRNVRFYEYGAYALLTAGRKSRMIAWRRQLPQWHGA